MAIDDFKTEYHLTSKGWVTGTHYFFSKTDEEVAPPSDRIITVVHRVYQRSQWSSEEVTTSTVWKDPNFSSTRLLAFREEFPSPWEEA